MNTLANSGQTHKPPWGRKLLYRTVGSLCALALGLSLIGAAYAQEPAPHFYASAAHNGIWGADFVPEEELTFSIYDRPGGNLLWSGNKRADSSGRISVGGTEHPVDLVPGNQVVISVDGTPIKDLVLEAITVDLFDLHQGLLQGTAPVERTVLVGVAFDTSTLVMEVRADSVTGAWIADFDTPVPADYTWAGAQLFDIDGDATEANPYRAPAPTISISTSNNYLRADNFTPNASVTFTVYATPDQIESPLWSDSRTTDENGFAIIWPWEGPPDLVPGNYVVAADNANTRTLIVEPLTIEVFDPGTDYVSGTASPGEMVSVIVGNDVIGYPGQMTVYADEGGLWEADFAATFDFDWSMWGGAEVFDEDWDATVYHLGPPTPPPPSSYLRAFPDQDFVDGSNWPPEETVSLEVGGLVFGTTAGSDGHVEFVIAGHDLTQGDVLTMTSGDIVVVHTVKQLFVIAIDLEAQTVAGTVDGMEVVHVWTGGAELYVGSGEYGDWLADFSGLEDPVLFPGACGNAEAWGEGSSSTIVDWCVPPPPPTPEIRAWLGNQRIEGYQWLLGEWVSLEIYDPVNAATFTASQRVEGVEGGTFVGFSVDGWVLEPGQEITMTGGEFTKTHIILPVSITSADPELDVVVGTASSEGRILLCIYEGACDPPAEVVADASGFWQLDYAGAFDIRPGYGMDATEFDADGDGTSFDVRIPNPFLIAFPLYEAVEGWEWPDGATVYLSVDDPHTPVSPDLSRVGTMAVTTWGDPRTYVRFDFGEVYDLGVGDVVTVTDSVTEVTHVVMNLAVTDVDSQTYEIAGTADPDMQVTLWPHGFDQIATVHVAADRDGSWLASFRDVFDLVPGTGGRSQVVDEAGNATAVDWTVPLPVQIDIRPGSASNLVGCRATTARLPVAVLSAEGFDATQLYTDSIRFGRTGTEAEVIRIGRDERPLQHARDVNRDGLPDMIYAFRFGDTGFSCGDIPAGQRRATLEATLTGWMEGGSVEGTDGLTLVGPPGR